MRIALAIIVASLAAFLLGMSWPNQVDEDLRFPSQGINPPGGLADPGRNNVTGLLEFGLDEIIAGNFQMPHAWAAGTAITPHIHVICTTASTNVSKWRLDYSISNINGTLSANYGTYTAGTVQTLDNPNNVQKHVLLNFPAITMTGYTESCIVLWRLTRLAASNTDLGDIVLLEFDVHYKVEKLGKNI